MAVGEIEPLFASLCLFDARAGCRVSEYFHCDRMSEDVRSWLYPRAAAATATSSVTSALTAITGSGNGSGNSSGNGNNNSNGDRQHDVAGLGSPDLVTRASRAMFTVERWRCRPGLVLLLLVEKVRVVGGGLGDVSSRLFLIAHCSSLIAHANANANAYNQTTAT